MNALAQVPTWTMSEHKAARAGGNKDGKKGGEGSLAGTRAGRAAASRDLSSSFYSN